MKKTLFSSKGHAIVGSLLESLAAVEDDIAGTYKRPEEVTDYLDEVLESISSLRSEAQDEYSQKLVTKLENALNESYDSIEETWSADPSRIQGTLDSIDSILSEIGVA